MRYFKTTFIWFIVLAAIGGYSYIDFESTRIEEIRKDEETRLLPFSPKEVLSIVIKKEESILELERWDDGWRIVTPMTAKADGVAVEKFLGYVTDSRNDADYVMDPDPTPERLAEFGLAEPKLFATLKIGKKLEAHTLVFGDRAPSMGVAFAQIEGEKPIYRVLAAARGEADKDIYYFRDKSVLRLNPVMVDQLAVKREGTSIRAALPLDGKWVLEKPIEDRADHVKVFALLSLFANAEVKEFIVESKENLETYGLDKPLVDIVLWQSGDSEPTVIISVGKRSPEKRGYFVSMSDRENIFLLEEDVINAIPRHANDLRSKELFFFERDQLKRIEIREIKKSVVLVKDSHKEWRRNNVDGEQVDFNIIKEFLGELADTAIDEFVVDNTESLADLRLDPPNLHLLIWPEGSAVPLSLRVGKKTPTGNMVYAISGSQSDVVLLDSRIERVLRTYF